MKNVYLSFAKPNSVYLIRGFPLLTFLWVCRKISSISYISPTAKEQDRTVQDRLKYEPDKVPGWMFLLEIICCCSNIFLVSSSSAWFLSWCLLRLSTWATMSSTVRLTRASCSCQNDYKTVLVQVVQRSKSIAWIKPKTPCCTWWTAPSTSAVLEIRSTVPPRMSRDNSSFCRTLLRWLSKHRPFRVCKHTQTLLKELQEEV